MGQLDQLIGGVAHRREHSNDAVSGFADALEGVEAIDAVAFERMLGRGLEEVQAIGDEAAGCGCKATGCCAGAGDPRTTTDARDLDPTSRTGSGAAGFLGGSFLVRMMVMLNRDSPSVGWAAGPGRRCLSRSQGPSN